jgi:tetratricopeptide (TPR) repeat protein
MVNVLRLRLDLIDDDRLCVQVQALPLGQFSFETALAPLAARFEDPVSKEGAKEQGRLVSHLLFGIHRNRFQSLLAEACKGSQQPSLCVESRIGSLLTLPWEFLEASPGTMLLSDNRVPVYRSLGEPSLPRISERPRLLVVSANPATSRFNKLVEADSEVSEVASRMREHAQVRTLRGATAESLLLELQDFKPHLFHFVGHGSAEGLVLEGEERGRELLLPFAELGKALHDAGVILANLSCCSLASCAETLLSAGVPAVLIGSGQIEDSAHRALVFRFYEAFGAGERIDRALAHAQWHVHDFDSMWRARLFLRGEPFSIGRKQEWSPDIFLGRQEELSELRRLLLQECAPLASVVGIGGTGKTTLVREFISLAGSAFDKVVFLDCGAFVSSDQVLSALSKEFDLGPSDDIKTELEGQRVLVCLDSLEGVVATSCSGLADLTGLGIQLLISSRIGLSEHGEQVLSLGGLADPESGEDLFGRWCRKLGVGEVDRDVAKELVRLVDGHPLALIVAAGRLENMSPSDLLDIMRRSLHGPLPDVQRLIDQALAMIETDERRLLQRLSSFVGWFSLRDAAQVLDRDLIDLADAVASLKRRGLVVGTSGQSLVKILDPIREGLASIPLSEMESVEAFEDQSRFRTVFLEHARVIGSLLEESRWGEARDLLWLHLPNFRRAVSICFERRDWNSILTFVSCLHRFLFELGVWPDFELLLEAGTRAAEETEDVEATARLLGLKGAWEARTGRYAECYRTWESRAEFAGASGLLRHEIDALLDLGAQYEQDSNFKGASQALRDAHELSRGLEDSSTRSNVQVILARHCQRIGNSDEALRLIASATKLADSSNEDIVVRVFLNISRYYRDQDAMSEAERFLHKALSFAIRSEHPYILSTLLLDGLKLKSILDDAQLIGAFCAALTVVEQKVRSRLYGEAMKRTHNLKLADANLDLIVDNLVQQPLQLSLNIILERMARRH